MPFTSVFACHAAGSDFKSLPDRVADRTRMIVFDELACALVGRELPPGRLIADHVRGRRTPGTSRVIGREDRTAAHLAALANGTAGHADEFDGAHVTDGHPGAVIVHAAVAVAERVEASGADLLNAVALGYDVGTRLVGAVGGAYSLRRRHHIHSDHLHTYGAAAAVARLSGFSEDQHRHALALCSGNAGGLATVFAERRHLTKSLSNGQAASAGVMAADLVAAGFEGVDDIFDTEHGPLAWAEGLPDGLGGDLGRRYAVDGANFKFYSAGYPIHAPAEAALRILSEHGLAPADIEEIVIGLNAHTHDTVGRRTMHSIDVRHMTALAIVHEGLDFDVAHSDTAHDHADVAMLRGRARTEIDGELERLQPDGRGARVTILTRSGARHDRLVEHPLGHSLRGGVDWEALQSKWEGLLGARIGAAAFGRYLDTCQMLDASVAVADLLNPLSKAA